VDYNKIRIKDIAEKANVSVGTVDRVLHNRGEVAQETKDLINKIVQELGYKPNIIASTLAQKRSFSFAILLPLGLDKNDYWNAHLRGIENAEKEVSHFGIRVKKYFYDINDKSSYKTQCEIIKDALPDAALLMPAYEDVTDDFIQGLALNNTPYVFIDTDSDTANKIAFTGQDSYKSGYLASKLMSYGITKDATVLIINIAKDPYTDFHSKARIQGFKAYLSENDITETKIRTIEISSNEDAEVKKILTNAFLDYSFVRGLFITGSEIHKVARFIDEKKLGNIRLIGFDLLENNVNYLKKGTIDFLISQKPEEQGYKSLMNLFNHLVLKKSIQQNQLMPIDIITKENVDYYYICNN
jgi:LacI family transcriptional regulator